MRTTPCEAAAASVSSYCESSSRGILMTGWCARPCVLLLYCVQSTIDESQQDEDHGSRRNNKSCVFGHISTASSSPDARLLLHSNDTLPLCSPVDGWRSIDRWYPVDGVVVAHKIEERPSNVDFRFQLTTETETIFEYSKVINKFPSHFCPATLTRIRSFKVRVCVCHLRYYTRSWWRWPSVSVSPVALRDDGPWTAFFVSSCCCYCFPFHFEAFIVLCLCGGYCKTVVRPFGQEHGTLVKDISKHTWWHGF